MRGRKRGSGIFDSERGLDLQVRISEVLKVRSGLSPIGRKSEFRESKRV